MKKALISLMKDDAGLRICEVLLIAIIASVCGILANALGGYAWFLLILPYSVIAVAAITTALLRGKGSI